MAELVFWICFLLVGHAYLFYPCLLFLIYSTSQARRDLKYLAATRDRRRADIPDEALPPVSVIIPAFNEERTLERKIANFDTLDYPADKLDIIFASDGSNDRTEEMLRRIDRPNVRAIVLPERRGKPTALNEGVRLARHDILIFSDAATLLERDAIRRLVRHFSDPEVGVVCGALRFEGGAQHRETEGVYWKYETALRLMEGRLGATLTASGAMYAMRRCAYSPLKPETITDDLVAPMNARRLGYKVVFDPEAVATDFAAETVADEYARRVRIAVGSFRALNRILATRMSPTTYLAFLSHKLLRWSLPFFLIGALISNVFLLDRMFYQGTFAAQALFYSWSGVGYLLRNHTSELPHVRFAYYLVAIHLAYLVGFLSFLANRGDVKWQRSA